VQENTLSGMDRVLPNRAVGSIQANKPFKIQGVYLCLNPINLYSSIAGGCKLVRETGKNMKKLSVVDKIGLEQNGRQEYVEARTNTIVFYISKWYQM